jgi:hypothetical protein
MTSRARRWCARLVLGMDIIIDAGTGLSARGRCRDRGGIQADFRARHPLARRKRIPVKGCSRWSCALLITEVELI